MSFVSTKICWFVEKSFTFCKILHFHPFSWNKRLNEPEECKSNLGRLIWFLNIGVVLVHYLFVVEQTIRLHLAGNLSLVRRIYMLLLIVLFSLQPTVQLGNFRMKDQVPKFIKQFFYLMEQFGDSLNEFAAETHSKKIEKGKKRSKKTKKSLMPKSFDIVFTFLDAAGATAAVLTFFLNIFLPESCEFISSVVLPSFDSDSGSGFQGSSYSHGILRWVVILTSGLCHSYNWFALVANMYVWLFTGFAFVFATIVTLRLIKSVIKQNVQKKQILPRAKIQRILRMYVDLELLRASFHYIYCSLMFPVLKGAGMLVVIFSVYGTIKMGGFIKLFFLNVGLGAGVVLILMVAALAEIHTQSSEIRELMETYEFQQNLDGYGKAMVRSLSLIQIKMSDSYVVDKECVRTVFRTVLEGSIQFLLMNP